MMPRCLLVAFLLFALLFGVNAQVYHYKTGKVIPFAKSGQVVWEKGVFLNYPVDYGTLVVKENRYNISTPLITLPVIRIKSYKKDSTSTPVFLLYGGPGESNLQSKLLFDSLLLYHDIVIVGYRGVDGSVKLECQQLQEALLSDSLSFANAEELFAEAFKHCLSCYKSSRIDISGYSMAEVSEDIEDVRRALKYPKISFLAYSYGTMISQMYCQKYPQNIDRMVLIGARPINDFIFTPDDYNKLQVSLFKRYYTDTVLSDSNIIEKIASILDTIVHKYNFFNEYRFFLFGFSKLYSIEESDELISAYEQAYKGNYQTLKQMYDDFYRVFLSKVTLGDMLLKKQNSVAYTDSVFKDNIGQRIINSVNMFYTPYDSLLLNTNKNNNSIIYNSVKVLFISADKDIASPYSKMQKQILIHYPKAKVYTVQDAGHLDLFYSKRNIVKSAVIDFFIVE